MARARAPTGGSEEIGALVALNVKSCFEALGLQRGLLAAAEAGFSDVVLWTGKAAEFVGAAGPARELGLRVVGMATPKLTASAPSCEAAVDLLFSAALAAEVPVLGLIFGDREDAWGPPRTLIDRLRTAPLEIAIENTADAATYTSSPARLDRLAESLGSCRTLVDLGHAAVAGVGVEEFDPGRVAWTDLHDNEGAADRHWPLGRGSDAGDSCAALTPTLAAGPLVIETDAAAGTDLEVWVESLSRDLELAATAARLRIELPGVAA